MKTILGILVLAVLALAGYRRSFVRIGTHDGTGTHRFLTGTEFILIGFLLGDTFLGILDQTTLEKAHPVLIIGLGWIGLITGLQLEWRSVRAFPGKGYLLVLMHSLWLLGFVFCTAYAILSLRYQGDPMLATAAAVLAVAALSSAQTLQALWARHTPSPRQDLLRGLLFIAGTKDVLVVVAYGILVASSLSYETAGALRFVAWQKISLTILMGLLMGFLFLILFRTRLAGDERSLVVIGLVLFGGGVSFLMGISPLLLHLIAGLVLANFSVKRDQAFRLLVSVERPLYFAFLLMAGAYLRLPGLYVVGMGLAYAALRALAMGTGGRLFLARLFDQIAPGAKKPSPGWGLLSQGGIAVALAMHFRIWLAPMFHRPLLEAVFSVLLIAILLNEVVSPYGLAYVTREEKP